MPSIVQHAFRHRPRATWAVGLFLLAILVFAGAALGIELDHQADRVASIWPPNAFLLIPMLAVARRCWSALLLAGLAGNLAADLATGDTPLTATVLSACNALEITLAAELIRRWCGPGAPDLTLPRNLFGFAMAGCLAAPVISAVPAAAYLHLTAGTPFLPVFRRWFAADALGVAIIVPLGLVFLTTDPRRLLAGRHLAACRRIELPLATVPLATVTTVVFTQSDFPLLFCVLPPLFFAVSRLAAGGAAIGSVVMAAIAIVCTIHGSGPLALVHGLDMGGRILLLQCFLLVATTSALWMASVVGEGERLAREMREGEARFRLLAEHASDVVSRVEPDGRRSYVSPASAHVFGVPPGWLYDRDIFAFVDPEDIPVLDRSMHALLTGQSEQARVRYRTRHPERGEVWLEEVGRAWSDPATGALDGYVALTRDVTEVVHAELAREAHARELEAKNASLDAMARNLERLRQKAEQASRVKTQFLASVSHELRTPLNGVLGYAHLLQLGGRLDRTQTRHVEAMLEAGQHLLDMINRVLTLSEIETEWSDARWNVVDPLDLARSCLDLVRPSALPKRLVLRLDLPPSPLPPLVTDLTRLRQVLLNLLGNAVKYTQTGAVTLRLSAPPGTALRVEVIDTGIGITQDGRARLFKEFDRLGQEVTGTEGAGLGLALSNRLATRLGGTLGYAPNPTGGSIFWLELPASTPRPPPPEVQASQTPAPQPPAPLAPSSLRVLVADDVAMNRDIAAAFLQSAGHRVTFATDGAQAVAAVAASDYDLVFLDVRMPGMDGLEAARRIRALPGARGRVPIIALTAQAFSEQVAECRAAGMTDHLSKPFTPAALLAALAKAERPGARPLDPVGA